MSQTFLRTASASLLLSLAVLLGPSTAFAILPGLDGLSPAGFDSMRRALGLQPASCANDNECVKGWKCHNFSCVTPEEAERLANRDALVTRRPTPRENAAPRPASGAAPSAPVTALATPTAEELCGADRRCRIERMKSNNRARRQQRIFEEERHVQAIVNDYHSQQKEASSRLNNPWTVDFIASALGWGFSGGYSFTSTLRAEGSFIRNSGYMYYWDNTTSLSGYHDAWFFNAQGVFFPMETAVTPYLAAGFMLGTGTFGSDSWGGWGTTDTDVKYHVVHASGGVDAQFDLGLHLRLGFRYGYVLYNQAAIAPGVYDPVTRDGLERWMGEKTLGIDFNLGWAF
jgi:hypothetical protein